MISLTCTKCQTVMSIDDAFAGGVCRCQRCGTIQTVPSRLKQAAGATSREGKTLYTKTGKPAEPAVGGAIPSGTGLDELATAVSSSGLTSSGGALSPRKRPAARGTPVVETRSSKTRAIVLGVCFFVVLGIGAALYMVLGHGGTSTRADTSSTRGETAATPATIDKNQPNFAGIPLKSKLVIYVLDRGSASKDVLGYVKEAAFASAASLGSDRRFQVIFWDNGAIDTYPTAGPAFATADKVEGARKALDEVTSYGQSNAIPAIAKARDGKASEIVLVTAKGWELDDAFVADVLKAAGQGVTIHTVSVNSTGKSEGLSKIASSTGGTYKAMNLSDLRAALP